MRKMLAMILVLFVSGCLFGQSDSSFVAVYLLNYNVHPIWNSESAGLGAGNVFLDYSGNPVMQSWMCYNADPPPGSGDLSYVSPFAVFSPSGDYLDTIVPSTGFGLRYRCVIPNGEGGYWALHSEPSFPSLSILHKLDLNFEVVENLTLTLNSGDEFRIEDFMLFQGGFLACGYSLDRQVLAFFSQSGIEIWHRSYTNTEGNFTLGISSSGNAYYHHGNNILLTSAEGDSLNHIVISGIIPSRIIERNDIYYAVEASSNFLRVYNLGLNAQNTNPQAHVVEIPVAYNSSVNVDFALINTSDGGFAFLLQSPLGEVIKFDADFNYLWSSNNLQYEIISNQKHPLMELTNGDLLYACGVNHYSWTNGAQYFALTRITSQGVQVDDPELPQPILLQLGPNPFHRELTMEYKGTKPEKPIVKVYNIKGQIVQTITLDTSQVNWQPNNLAAGVYIVKLFEGELNVSTQRVTYLK